MKVGIPRELKDHEYRVAITPAGVNELARAGHRVYVEKDAGVGSSIPDDDFIAAGAEILADPDDVWDVDLVLKVKEPVAEEYGRMRSGRTLFTYLHLAASRECTEALLKSGIDAVAYETVQLADGSLPLLAPMSEVAGRMAPQVGAHTLERAQGGRGVLMGGVSGVYAAKVVVIGAGVSGMNAAAIALGMQAEVLLLDRNIDRCARRTRSTRGTCRRWRPTRTRSSGPLLDADLVIGAVLVPGAKAPRLVPRRAGRPGRSRVRVLVDISVDQGGCFESSRPTTHSDPTFTVASSVFYCVANMPGAVPHTSTYALTNVTHAVRAGAGQPGTAGRGARRPRAAAGGQRGRRQVTSTPVAEAHGMIAVPVEQALSLDGAR